jgi:hypothetical protein
MILGVFIGGLLAAALVKGFAIESMGPVLAYLFAALSGALVGLVAGKPIWAKDGAIEAGLKAVFGALLAAGGMFALRQWGGGFAPNLTALSPGLSGAIGDDPAAALPAIAAVLGAFYGLVNTPSKDADKGKGDAKAAEKKGAPASKSKARVAVEEPADEEEAEAAPARKAKK